MPSAPMHEPHTFPSQRTYRIVDLKKIRVGDRHAIHHAAGVILQHWQSEVLVSRFDASRLTGESIDTISSVVRCL